MGIKRMIAESEVASAWFRNNNLHLIGQQTRSSSNSDRQFVDDAMELPKVRRNKNRHTRKITLWQMRYPGNN